MVREARRGRRERGWDRAGWQLWVSVASHDWVSVESHDIPPTRGKRGADDDSQCGTRPRPRMHTRAQVRARVDLHISAGVLPLQYHDPLAEITDLLEDLHLLRSQRPDLIIEGFHVGSMDEKCVAKVGYDRCLLNLGRASRANSVDHTNRLWWECGWQACGWQEGGRQQCEWQQCEWQACGCHPMPLPLPASPPPESPHQHAKGPHLELALLQLERKLEVPRRHQLCLAPRLEFLTQLLILPLQLRVLRLQRVEECVHLGQLSRCRLEVVLACNLCVAALHETIPHVER